MKTYFILLAVIYLLPSCAQPLESSPKKGGLRVILESAYGVPLEIRAYAEGSDGQFLTGALVRVQFPSQEVSVLNYKPSEGCFYSIKNPVSKGEYQFRLSSKSLSEDLVLSLEHTPLDKRPVLNELESSTSKSALKGDVLPIEQVLNVGWSEVPGANSYSVQVTNGSAVVYGASTTDTALEIPANCLPAGRLTILVKAQFLRGDPSFREADYYSVSHSMSSIFQFSTQ